MLFSFLVCYKLLYKLLLLLLLLYTCCCYCCCLLLLLLQAAAAAAAAAAELIPGIPSAAVVGCCWVSVLALLESPAGGKIKKMPRGYVKYTFESLDAIVDQGMTGMAYRWNKSDSIYERKKELYPCLNI